VNTCEAAQRSVVAVIPAYNAGERIAATVAGLAGRVDAVWVVDDGSKDETAALARDAGARVVSQRRQGPGGAVLAGLRAARDDGAAIAIVVDADGQMDPARIPALLAPILEGQADLCRGDRLARPGEGDTMPWLRRRAANGLAGPASFCAGQPIQDPLSGFVALRLSHLPAALWPGFGYPLHLAAAVSGAGGRIAHVPVPARYPADGVSHHGLHRAPSVLGALVSAARARLASGR